MPLKGSSTDKRRLLRWALLAVIVVLIAGGVILAIHWPFAESLVVDSLQADLHGIVRVDEFHASVFPHPGCEIERLRFWRAGSDLQSPPIATVEKMTIQGRYTDFILRPGYIERIAIQGLRAEIPARVASPKSNLAQKQSKASVGIDDPLQGDFNDSKLDHSDKSHQMRIGEIVTTDASLAIQRQDGKQPLEFLIHSLVLHSVMRGKPFSYKLAMSNAEPPGEIVSSGTFGPWNQAMPAQTPVSGTYHFERADLGVFHGIAGTLSSDDKFSGVLGQIHVSGNTDIRDFALTRTNHAVNVSADFEAVVDAMNGDVFLRAVNAFLLQTTIRARGKITGTPGQHGKTTFIELEVENGRIEDLLFFFTKGMPPSLSGATVIHARATIPQKGQPFLKEMMLDGDFRIVDGRFNKPATEAKVEALSQKGLADPKHLAPDKVVVALQGNVAVHDAVAKFSNVSFSVPGAVAEMIGTYNLITYAVDFHGELKTEAELSQTTTGIKSALLKPLDFLFKKKNAGAMVPVKMTGTYKDHHFGLDLR